MSLDEYGIAISLSLTAVFLLYDQELLRTWWGTYKAAAQKTGWFKFWIPLTNKGVWTEAEWLCVGIFSGFMFNGLDNLYWAISWAHTYYDNPIGELMVDNGSWANIVFRQLGGIWAIWCHVIAAKVRHNKTGREYDVPYWFSGGFILSLLLFTH